jgi:hypothetical protein
MIDWQPIETAPRNGRSVLIFVYQAWVPMVRLAWYKTQKNVEELGGDPEEVGWWSFPPSCGSEKLSWEPTHRAVWEGPRS